MIDHITTLQCRWPVDLCSNISLLGFQLNDNYCDRIQCFLFFVSFLTPLWIIPWLQLLRGQKKAVKKEQVAKSEAERRRLSTVLQVQHLLHSLQQEHVRRDLLAGHNQAPHIPAQQLHSLSQLSALLGVKRDNRLRWVYHCLCRLTNLCGNELRLLFAYAFCICRVLMVTLNITVTWQFCQQEISGHTLALYQKLQLV